MLTKRRRRWLERREVREVRQDELGLRRELERVQVVALGHVELAAAGVHAPEVVVAEDRCRIARDQLLEDRDRLVEVAALPVERAQVEVGLLDVRVDREHALVAVDRLGVAAERRQHAALERQRLEVVRFRGRDHLDLLERLVESALSYVELCEAQTQPRGGGIFGDRLLELLDRGRHVVLRERHLTAQEMPERFGVFGQLDRRPGHTSTEEPIPDPCTAAQQDHGNHRNGRDAGPHDRLPSTLTDGPTKRKPFHAQNCAPQRPSRRSHSRITPGAIDDSG